MKAAVLQELNHPLAIQEVPDPQPSAGQVTVHLRAAALNHRDVFISKGLYANIQLPAILGSDGAGEWEGQKVLIDPSFRWGSNENAQGRDFHILGMPSQGTFAQEVAVPRENLYAMPDHLTWAQAAALPLAGVTAWRVLMTRCGLQTGEKILITGIGGGVALMALSFAVAQGAEVYVTSGSAEKIERAGLLGAYGGANYREAGWDKRLREQAGGFDVIIDSAGGEGFAALPALCNPGTRIGVYGGSAGKINGLSPQMLFWKQISILGSTMGTAEDFNKMLDFVEKHKVVPVVDEIFPLEQINKAMQRMDEGQQFGKIVLHIRD